MRKQEEYMTKTGWIIFVTAVVLVLGSLIAWTRIANPPLDVSAVNTSTILVGSDASGTIGDHVMGNKDSKVVLIEYGDFQCPGCAGASPNMKLLMDEYGDKIAFVFRNFPLTTIHPNAKAAAAAAEAAGLQGKYWEMNLNLFQAQAEWKNADPTSRTEIFNKYAEALQLNSDTFKQDLASEKVAKKISFDQALGKKDEVSSTPTFILNGKKISDEAAQGISNSDLTALKKEIDALL